MAAHHRRGGEPLDPTPQTKVTIVGNNEIYNREPYTNFWVPDPPSPPSNTSLSVPIHRRSSTAPRR